MKFKYVPPMIICPECGDLMVESYLEEEFYCVNLDCKIYEKKFALPEFEVDKKRS